MGRHSYFIINYNYNKMPSKSIMNMNARDRVQSYKTKGLFKTFYVQIFKFQISFTGRSQFMKYSPLSSVIICKRTSDAATGFGVHGTPKIQYF